MLELATAARGADLHGYRTASLDMVRKAKALIER
jgi:hypothetical protein